MKRTYNHDQIEEVIRVLRAPQNYWPDFSKKYKENQEMLQLYEEFRRYKEAGHKLELNVSNSVFQWKDFYAKIQYQEQKRKVRMRFLVASIAVLFACGVFFQLQPTSIIPKQLSENLKTIEKGNSKAVLVTSNGEQVYLEDGEDKVIHEESGVQILADSTNVVQYDKLLNVDKKADSEILFNTLKVPRLGEYQLVLSDGTKVWMNSESELRYPVQFTGKRRAVELIAGEAYFDVQKDTEREFWVKANGIITKVLGTEFNVSAYPGENFNITLVEGKVQLDSDAEKNIILNPGQNASLLVGEEKLIVNNVDTRKYTAWRDGYFYFEKERLEDIFKKLERWYDCKVFYQNQHIKDYLFKMRADKNLDFEKVVRRLEQTGRISFEVRGNVVIVSDVNR